MQDSGKVFRRTNLGWVILCYRGFVVQNRTFVVFPASVSSSRDAALSRAGVMVHASRASHSGSVW